MEATTMELKQLSRGEIPDALERAIRYRKLNESAQAESICHDILLIDPENQPALVLLLLSLVDCFGDDDPVDFNQALEILPCIRDLHQRAFYAGVICDHRANAILQDAGNGCAHDAYQYLREAMDCYERAEALRPYDSGEARQRWNACLRMINRNHLEPQLKENLQFE